ncbi:unnamed protein product [Cyprideis torosa]|uniref:[acyl-carrier-protein] S-malonyltransferase n=1 Tax=Cyprideis torosa TaxID=163714 RepID=A0A7R8ZYP5_9CRUS|nr:unnamed protein product [Cyprideis torosa]CAG0908815.1 unnamed protein product [Cyprideis torosa]
MQKACDNSPGAMAAILGLEDADVEQICADTEGIVVPANYNCPGQLVISGAVDAVERAVELAKERKARRAILLPVNGAFHSPLMKQAEDELAAAIGETTFHAPKAPVYQNYTAQAETDIDMIRQNLINQLTGSVKWTQTMKAMKADGNTEVIESGAKVLSGFFRRFDREMTVNQI